MELSSEDWLIDQHLCRCCHSEGKFQSLTSTGLLMEDKLLYLDALRFCLDIELIPVERPLSDVVCYICEDCVVRLYEACSFRKQVLNCEERFQTLYIQNRIKVSTSESIMIEIKEELQDPEDVKYEDHDRDINLTDIEEDENDTPSPPKTESSQLLKLLAVSEEPEKKKQKKTKKRRVPKKSLPLTATEKPLQDKDAPIDEKKKKKIVNSLQDTDFVRTGEKKKATVYKLRDSDYVQKGDQLQCARCPKTFISISGLRLHVKSYHLQLYSKYHCDICNTSFRTIVPFIKHKLELHNIDERFKCNACDSIFNSKTQLAKHKNSFHMLGVKIKCPQCDYECFSVEGLYKHKFKHKTVKDYHCKFCKKSFLRKTTLDLHERIHTGDRRKICAECGQAFVQKASLNYHMMKYHPEVKF